MSCRALIDSDLEYLQELKAEKEAWKQEMAALFKPAQPAQKQDVDAGRLALSFRFCDPLIGRHSASCSGVDPKSVLCQFFKQGLCTKGGPWISLVHCTLDWAVLAPLLPVECGAGRQ